MDFLLKRERIVVEAKMTRKGLDQKKVGDELIIDMRRYRLHPDVQTLVCFVYAPGGYCKAPTALENDLSMVDLSFEPLSSFAQMLRQIRHGEAASFQLLFKASSPIQVEVIEVDEHPSSWFAWGSSPEHPGSIAEFTIEPDGSINAVISLPGIGQYGIRPSGELPYHVMYFTHGVSSYD
jgi:hypothetical protein